MEENILDNNPRIIALKAFGISEYDADEKISLIEKWIKESDFPEQMKRSIIEIFLIRNKFRIDVTQKKIAMYYKIRNQIPEFFEGKHPDQPIMKQRMKVSYFVFSPKLTPEGYTVNFFRLIDFNPKNLQANNFCGHMVNISELKLVRDVYSLGDVFVCDLDGSTFTHMYYFGVGTLRKLAKVIQEVFSTPIKAIHFINCPGYMNTLMAIIKAVLNAKIFGRIHIHKNPEDVSNFISKEILPEEYGGSGQSLEELNDFLAGQFSKFKRRFDELQEINEMVIEK